ncbi:MAG: cation transporter, partial [Brevibacterium sp.]|nr:cation transporter [Brevibacterium sp.]
NPTLRAVFAEDASALIGIIIAFAALLAHQLTGIAAFDSIGSILVGVLLGVVAIVLIDRNRRFLVGETVTPTIRDDFLESMLEIPAIASVSYLHVEYVGSGSVYLVAAVDLTRDDPESQLAVRLRRAEVEIEKLSSVQEVVLTPSAPGQETLEVGAQ